MGVYSKDNAGNIKQIAGNIVQRLNTRWFLCTRSIENDIEYYTVPASAQDYFKTIDSYTLYSLGFNEPNTTKYPVLRYGNIELDILDFTTEDGSINIGQLMGVFQMFTQDLSTDPKMYFVGNTHKDIGTGVSQEDFDALVNNETQIVNDDNTFKAGGTRNLKVNPLSAVIIGNDADSANFGVAIGRQATNNLNASIAIGNKSKTNQYYAIQLGEGTNSTLHSLQIEDDNIYKTDTHTLTVNNIEQDGNPVYAVLQGTTAPDTTTVGAVTQFYLNTIDKKLYQCKSITTSETDSTSTYEWQEVGGSSSGSSGGEIQEIQLDDTLTTGTLTTEQLAVLQENAQNYITYKSYVYRFANSNTYGLTYISIDADNIAAGTMGAYVKFNQIYISKSTGTWSYSGPATLRELYIHNIKGSPHPNYQDAKFTFYLSYINNMSYSLTMASNFIALLSGNGYTGSSCLTCNGFIQMNSINYMITGISRTSSNDGINLYGVNLDDLGSPSLILTLSDTQFILGDTYKEMR